MQIYKVGVILVIGLWLLANSQASAQTGPVNNPSTSTLFVDYQPPPRSYALVIGNDSYPEKPLENARHDAKLVAETLRRLHGFEVDLQLDLTSLQLRQKIRDFFDYMGQHKDARLLLWFAGHGASVDVRGESHGFLLPIDAPVTSPERRIVEIINKGVDVQGLRERIQKYVQARHVMVVIDSCFAGAVMVEPRKRGPDKESTTPAPERWNNPVRHFIAAGTASQKVFDDGKFAQVFVEAISGQSPSLTPKYPGYLTGTELGDHLYDYFRTNRKGEQHPVSRKMSSGIEEHDGDIVFGLKPVEKSGRWRVLLRPHLTSRFAQDLPELADLANRCAIGRRHRTPHKAAQDVLQYTDPRRNTVVHTFDSGQINPRTGQPVNGAALPVQTIERDGPLIRVQYGENGEMLLLPIDDERSSIPDDMGNFLLRGAWARDGGSGCIEFRLNVRSREGKGTVWLGLRNRFGIDVKGVTKEPLRSTLKVFPN